MVDIGSEAKAEAWERVDRIRENCGFSCPDATWWATGFQDGAQWGANHEVGKWYRDAAKHAADQLAEARATLQYFADRVDPFIFEELSSVLDDQPLDYETGSVIGKSKLRRSWHEGFCRGEVSGARETPLNPYTENPYL